MGDGSLLQIFRVAIGLIEGVGLRLRCNTQWARLLGVKVDRLIECRV